MVMVAVFSFIGNNAIARTGGETCLAPCEGFRTQTMGGWGANPQGNNPATLLQEHFTTLFGTTGVVVGGVTGGDGCNSNNVLKLRSAYAVNKFLPSGSTARALDKTYTNPTNGSEKVKGSVVYENVLAGQAVALTITLAFNEANINGFSSGTPLRDAVIAEGPFMGETVGFVLNEANRFLSGCTSIYTASQINDALSKINESYVDGVPRSGFLLCEFPKPTVALKAEPECDKPTKITATASGGKSPYTYAFTGPNNYTATNSTGIISVEVPGIYSVTVTDARKCEASAEVEAEVYISPSSAGAELELCESSAGSGEAGFDLTSAAEAILKDLGANVTITGWFTNGDGTGEIFDPAAFTSGNATVYAQLTNSDTDCVGYAEVTLKVNPLPVLTVDTPINICIGATYNLEDAVLSSSVGAILTYFDGDPNQ